MALQDLTPQLRTRLSRMEQAVGWFVVLALAVLAFGFVYYIYATAERKGWFKTKAPFFTFIDRATGLKVGDPVQLMGFDVGRITRIDAQPPYTPYNVYVQFDIQAPYDGYLWTHGSIARITAADLLGKRVIEVTKGTNGYPVYVFFPLRTNLTLAEARAMPELKDWVLAEDLYGHDQATVILGAFSPMTNLAVLAQSGRTAFCAMRTNVPKRLMTGMWNDKAGRYDPYTNGASEYWLLAEESPALTERLQRVVNQVEQALPRVLNLTNQLVLILSNSVSLTSNLNCIAVNARPAVSNLVAATAELGHPGALGEWLLPTNISRQIQTALGQTETTLAGVDTNLTSLAENLNRSLDNLAGITSNLNRQVEVNTNLLSAISETIVHADQFVQGLKRHWLLRSAFKPAASNAPPAFAPQRLRSPKQRDEK